jgi:VWFA-related protein
VTVIDDNGAGIAELPPSEFTLKEGGKARPVLTVERVDKPLQIVLAIEDSLTADNSARLALGRFVQQMQGRGEISLVAIGRRAVQLVDFTTDGNAVIKGINQFGLNPATQDDAVVESIFEMSRMLEKRETSRRVLVLIAIEGQQSSGMPADQALDELRKSGAVMYDATIAGSSQMGSMGLGAMADESARAKVLGEGPRQSGGLRVEVPATSGFPRALEQFAAELQGQYRLTYELPAGTKPSDRLNVSLKHKGLTLRAPTRVPKEED